MERRERYLRTVRQIVEHARLILDVDVEYPVIISAEWWLMDGMHRIARALLEDRPRVPARRFVEHVPPDFVDVRPAQLSYER